MKDIDTYTDTATEGLSTAWDMVLYKNHNGIEATADWYISNAVDYPKLWYEWVSLPPSPVTYYFNAYDSGGEEWGTTPQYMVDGDLGTEARDNPAANQSTVQLLTGNTCDGTDLGTITKVEIRAYTWVGFYSFGSGTKFRPVFGGSSDGDNHEDESDRIPDWTYYFDITSDTNAPATWSWTDVQNLDCDIEAYNGAIVQFTHDCYKVEIQVTYGGTRRIIMIQ